MISGWPEYLPEVDDPPLSAEAEDELARALRWVRPTPPTLVEVTGEVGPLLAEVLRLLGTVQGLPSAQAQELLRARAALNRVRATLARLAAEVDA